MTDLSIRRMIWDEILTAANYEYQANKNQDKSAVSYFQGYQDGLRNAILKIDFAIKSEINEMEKEENDTRKNTQNNCR